MARSVEFEREWFRQVARMAGLTGLTETFTDAAFARLDKGAQEYGEDSFMQKGEALLAEAKEEAIDLPAWSVLFAEYLRAQPEGDEDSAHLAMLHLLEAAANSLRAWYSLQQARELYEEARTCIR